MSNNLVIDDLFGEECDSVFFAGLSSVLSKTNIISSVRKEPFLNDEPKIYDFCTVYRSYGCDLKEEFSTAGGTDIKKEWAIFKSLGEAIERHCLSVQKREIFGSYKEFKEQAVDIFHFSTLNSQQKNNSNLKQFVYTENDGFYWYHGYHLFDLQKKMIPSQLIFVPYKYNKEKIIRESISTGAALSTSLGGAIYRGVCEVVERDAFMIAYLNKTKRCLIDLKASGRELMNIFEMSCRYKLEPIIVDITTDLGIPSMLGLVIDRTGLGPAVSVGLSADLNPKVAAIKAIKEAFHSRPWIRKSMIQKKINKNINTFEGRALYWSDVNMIDKLNFLISGNKYPVVGVNKFKTIKEKIEELANIFNKCNLNVFFVDVTTPEIRKCGFCVVKVITPDLMPLYLDEIYKDVYSNHPRLNSLKLNRIPHPFL
jgi:ribosomal protein S12 methylthiotransferase accessory factor